MLELYLYVPCKNWLFLDLFLRHYCSVLFLFAPAVCFLVFFFVLCIFCFVVCACCYLSHMPLNNGYKICFYLFGLSTVAFGQGFFFPPSSLFLQLLFGSVFCILWERIFSNCTCDGLVSAVGLENFASLIDFFVDFGASVFVHESRICACS